MLVRLLGRLVCYLWFGASMVWLAVVMLYALGSAWFGWVWMLRLVMGCLEFGFGLFCLGFAIWCGLICLGVGSVLECCCVGFGC